MTTQALQFTLETVDDSAVLGQSFLTVDGAGEPAVAYVIGTSVGAAVRVARRHNGHWTHENTGGFPAGDDVRISLSFDSGGVPHIAYRDGDSGNAMFGTRGDDGGWSLEPIPTQAGLIVRSAADVSMQIEPNLNDPPFADTPTVGYRDAFNGDSAAVARKVGGSWQISGVDAPSDVRTGLSLAFDSSAGLRLAYFQGFDDGSPVIPQPLKLAQEEVSDAGDPHPPTFVSRVIDPDMRAAESVSMARGLFSKVLVAYADVRTRTVRAWSSSFGSEPRIEVVAEGNDANGPRFPSAAGDPHQTLFIAYLDDGQVVLARRGPAGWTSQPVATGDGWPSLEFGKDGTAHLAYGTGTLMYARATVGPG
ncbi:hypothetical protein [Kitasatospora sp. A2-31]|uniref:hypothetical protein n=1 Tax=Kitasatospora sp. A2-31 TaxID=2916414 RepID=UPI001EEE5042|nr:hypothetical protein [Kitasatospora sp. A2-31]MCG6499904.1 hypothetical protein [Kitasatospora sp. A2-31]